MTHKRLFVAMVGLLLVALSAQGQQITASEAKNHIGENAAVCGKAVSTRYAASTRGAPTFLNLDKPYPDQIFTAVIWGSDRSKFGQPEQTYKGRDICVTGKVSDPVCARRSPAHLGSSR